MQGRNWTPSTTCLKDKDMNGVLIRVLRKTDTGLHALLYTCFHMTSLELYGRCFEKGNLQDACLALVLLDPSDAVGRVNDLRGRDGLDEETEGPAGNIRSKPEWGQPKRIQGKL